jgi:hypothetical protein
MQPRTIVLWVPLVLTYWSVLGLRAAFLVPSELPAAVTFACHGPSDTHAYWSGVRGATIAVLAIPVTFIALVVTGLLVGWPIAAWHAAFVAGIVVTLVELSVLSLDRVPFTRPYAAGDGLLRKRWPLYLFGMFAFAYWPVRIELRLLGGGEPWLVAGAAGAAVVCHLVGRAGAPLVGRARRTDIGRRHVIGPRYRRYRPSRRASRGVDAVGKLTRHRSRHRSQHSTKRGPGSDSGDHGVGYRIRPLIRH